jgi:hypothetical protein
MAHKNQFYEADLAGLKDSSNWPVWPMLPVKKYEETTRMPVFGVVYAKDTKPIIYLNANIFMLGADPGLTPRENSASFQVLEMHSSVPEELKATVADRLAAYQKVEYQTFEAMLDDGWMVD